MENKTVYDCGWFQVLKVPSRKSTESDKPYHVISKKNAVGILAITRENTGNPHVLMVRQYRVPLQEEIWEIPAGTLDKEGESISDCACRELLEETGYVAGKMRFLGSFCMSPGYTTEVVHLFEATELTKTEAVVDPEEISAVKEVSIDIFRDWILTGNVRDAKSALAFTLAVL